MSTAAHFQVDPRLATLLGESYRATEYAIKELVDNAWDADAGRVDILLPDPLSSDPIVVADNGVGMTEKEIKNEYLKIANDRISRKGEFTPLKRRKVKGRKGIGKFAGLMTANIMELETKARGKLVRLQLSRHDLIESGKDLEKIPLPIESKELKENASGTTITLRSLNQNFDFPNPDRLRQILVYEYGRELGFEIYVNGELCGLNDIPGETFDEEIDLPEIGKIKLRFTVAEGGKNLRNPGVTMRVGGKIVGKPSFFGLEDDDEIPAKLRRKIYGEIEADGLADDVTADWGAIIENSKAYQKIKAWTKSSLKTGVEKSYTNEVNLAKARHQKEINNRLAELPEHRRAFAQRSLDKIFRRFFGESDARIGTIISVVLDSFERDEYWLVVKEIGEAKHQDVESLAEALQSFGIIEMSNLIRQTRRRIKVLDDLDLLIRSPDTIEQTVHKALEKNLWVFGVEYSLMSSNATLKRVIEDYTGKRYSGERASVRPDLLLSRDVLDRKLLIEFKRPSHTIVRDDENQAEKYRDDLTPDFGAIDILVVGGKIDPKISNHYQQPDIQLLSYNAIISKARTELEWLIKELSH